MKTRMLILTVAALAAGSGGCSHMNNTEKGMGIGGALGAGTGLAIGAATGNPKTGAAVGGLLGAGVGGLVGADKDREVQEKRDLQQATAVANAQAQQRMGLTDVVHMAQAGHEDQVIINQIRSTGSAFQLSAGDLDFLKSNSVSTRVIVEMQNARGSPVVVQPSRPVVIREHPAVIYREPPPVMIIHSRPPPPRGVFFEYGHH